MVNDLKADTYTDARIINSLGQFVNNLLLVTYIQIVVQIIYCWYCTLETHTNVSVVFKTLRH